MKRALLWAAAGCFQFVAVAQASSLETYLLGRPKEAWRELGREIQHSSRWAHDSFALEQKLDFAREILSQNSEISFSEFRAVLVAAQRKPASKGVRPRLSEQLQAVDQAANWEGATQPQAFLKFLNLKTTEAELEVLCAISKRKLLSAPEVVDWYFAAGTCHHLLRQSGSHYLEMYLERAPASTSNRAVSLEMIAKERQ